MSTFVCVSRALNEVMQSAMPDSLAGIASYN